MRVRVGLGEGRLMVRGSAEGEGPCVVLILPNVYVTYLLKIDPFSKTQKTTTKEPYP